MILLDHALLFQVGQIREKRTLSLAIMLVANGFREETKP